jgi:hypothetical protein
MNFRCLYILFIISFLILIGCEKTYDRSETKNYLLLPAGRSSIGKSLVKLYVDSIETNTEKVYDGNGGYWFKLDKSLLHENSDIELIYTRQKENVVLFKDTDNNISKWLSESYYIDCNNITIKAKASELTKGIEGTIEKSKKIQQYVAQNIALTQYKDAFDSKASQTLELKYGICINFSRLFVALCRAVNIPSRSVWGVIYGYNNDNIYDYHHQWAEVLDSAGYWHPLDFKYNPAFDFSDIRYTDLLYAAEENTFLTDSANFEIVLGNVTYFNNYPASLSGKLGFQLVEDKRPEYMIVKYAFQN